MEFNKLKGIWKTKSQKKGEISQDFDSKADFSNSFADTTMLLSENIHQTKEKKATVNTIKSKKVRGQKWANFLVRGQDSEDVFDQGPHLYLQKTLEPLEEIEPEVTSEGFGLRTPYGTHLDLDFVKYCEATDNTLKRSYSMRTSKSTMTSSQDINEGRLATSQKRLVTESSNECPSAINKDNSINSGRSSNNKVGNSLLETKRRLEAFRSFRTKGPRPLLGPFSNAVADDCKDGIVNGNKNETSVSSKAPGDTAPASGCFKISSQQLRVVRTQMANALLRIKELEGKLDDMAALQKRLSTTQEEKQQLLKELQSAKSQLKKQENQNKQDCEVSVTSSLAVSYSLPPPQPNEGTPSFLHESQKRAYFKELRPLPEIPYETPPPTPKRKYCSVAVGGSTPLDDSKCFCSNRKTFACVGTSCDLIPKKFSKANFSSIVNGSDIDKELGLPPPLPKKKSFRVPPLANGLNFRETSSQTDVMSSAELQQSQILFPMLDAGSGDGIVFEMVDKSSSTPLLIHCDVSIMTDSLATHDRFTSSHDLVQCHDPNENTSRKDASTATTATPFITTATSCDDLILQKNHVGGNILRDAEASTDFKSTQNAGVQCTLADQARKSFSDKATMTLISGEKSRFSITSVPVASGDDQSVTRKSSSVIECNFEVERKLCDIESLHEGDKIGKSYPLDKTVPHYMGNTKDKNHALLPDNSKSATETTQNHNTFSFNPVKTLITKFSTLAAPTNQVVFDNLKKTAKKQTLKGTSINEKYSSNYVTSLPYTPENDSPSTLMELKSIMKKPGTPTGRNKFLRFANDVIPDYDYSTSEDDESSSESSDEEFTTEIVKIFLKTKTGKNESENVENDQPESANKLTRLVESNGSFANESENTTKDNSSQFNSPFNNQVSNLKNNNKVNLDSMVINLETSVEKPANSKFHPNLNPNPKNSFFNDDALKACIVLKEQEISKDMIENDTTALASATIQKAWFKVSARMDSSVEEMASFLSNVLEISSSVCQKVVNMTDFNGNTVLHYAISHGNHAVVERLLLLDYLDVNVANLAGYTPVMLASLCDIEMESDGKIFEKLFRKSKVNEHAKEAGQTALMLAASHGRTKMVELLLKCGAEINATDFDGSTALMCAAEHGKLDVVKTLVGNPDCNISIADADGCTALKIALDAKHKEIAVLLYAQMNFFSATRYD